MSRSSLQFSFLFLLFSLLVTPTLAASGHLTLLTVAQAKNGTLGDGSTADLYLETRPGNGQIFIDSFPLTRLDTQGSTRYANQVACAYVDADCSRYDFLYTIRAGSTVVGGPSAGAAVAVLTAAVLEHRTIDESIAITGTINSGAIIGPVGGMKEKALAAKKAGLSKVLISAFAFPTELNRSYAKILNTTKSMTNTTTKTTINLSRLYTPVNLSATGIPIVEVATLDDALRLFSGKEPHKETGVIQVNTAYARIMAGIANDLCHRRDSLYDSLLGEEKINDSFFSENRTSIEQGAAEAQDWYSLASYCFSDLISLRGQDFKGLNEYALKSRYASLVTQADDFEKGLSEREVSTLAQLETYMIVSERVREAKKTLREMNRSNISSSELAFAYERFNSAKVWSAFFSMESSSITLDEQHLRDACAAKIIEAEERIAYADLYLSGSLLDPAREEVRQAKIARDQADYPLCLFRSSKAQATADLFSSTMGISKKKIDSLVQGKLAAARTVIREQEAKGYFPIVGYSYYRYASSLAPNDQYSALTFAEYALELSGLDIFFPREEPFHLDTRYLPLLLIFCGGLLFGLLLSIIISPKRKNRRKRDQ